MTDNKDRNLEGATPGPWRISDAHGLCIVVDEPDGRMVADFSPDSSQSGWWGRRQDAELIVEMRNGWDALQQERDNLIQRVQQLQDEISANSLHNRVAVLEAAVSEIATLLMGDEPDEDCDCELCQSGEPGPTNH